MARREPARRAPRPPGRRGALSTTAIRDVEPCALRGGLHRAHVAEGVRRRRQSPTATRRSTSRRTARAEAPPHLGVIGLGMAGPTIIALGTEAQKARYLQPLLSADEIWCQGFSEPDAGSDLSGRPHDRAARRRSHFVVDGQKVWSSYAHIADWCILLTRSDPDSRAPRRAHVRDRRHEGARRRGAAAAPDHGRGGVQRDLLHRRRGAASTT